MKKRYFVILLVCLSFLFVSSASANMYAGVKVGYVMTTDSDVSESGSAEETAEWDGGFGVGVSVGAAMDQFRLEGEVEYRSADLDADDYDLTLKTVSMLANGYYDFAMDSPLKPYVGAGIGFAKHTADAEDGNEDDTVFAYQVTVGAAWAVSDTMDLDCAYRYFATADAEFDGTEISYGSHNISVGMRFKF